MGRVGRFVTDPRAGAYCQVVLDSGEKIVVNHDQGGFKGGSLTIEALKFNGLQFRPHLRLCFRQPGGRGRTDGTDPRRAGRKRRRRRHSEPSCGTSWTADLSLT